jgi:hypothetical protein
MSEVMLEQLETEPNFFNRVITDDESSFFEYEPETKRHSEEWRTPQSPRQKEAPMSKLKIKGIVIILYDSRGVFIKNLYHLLSQ